MVIGDEPEVRYKRSEAIPAGERLCADHKAGEAPIRSNEWIDLLGELFEVSFLKRAIRGDDKDALVAHQFIMNHRPLTPARVPDSSDAVPDERQSDRLHGSRIGRPSTRSGRRAPKGARSRLSEDGRRRYPLAMMPSPLPISLSTAPTLKRRADAVPGSPLHPPPLPPPHSPPLSHPLFS